MTALWMDPCHPGRCPAGAPAARTDSEARISHFVNILRKWRNDNIKMATPGASPATTAAGDPVSRLPRYRRLIRQRLGSPATALCTVLALTGVSCSHTAPYYRADLRATMDLQLEASELSQQIILIGDAGVPLEGEPVLKTLGEWAALAPERTTVVFLGDNIYESGMPDTAARDRGESERRLLARFEPSAPAEPAHSSSRVITTGATAARRDWRRSCASRVSSMPPLTTRRASFPATGARVRLHSISPGPGEPGQPGSSPSTQIGGSKMGFPRHASTTAAIRRSPSSRGSPQKLRLPMSSSSLTIHSEHTASTADSSTGRITSSR